MNASYEWLRTFVPFDLTPTELRDLLTSRCATVDDLVSLRDDLGDVVVGRVVEVKRHPNSDHLWLTKVDAGGGALREVVCGAPNVAADTLYPFAPVGSTLPGGSISSIASAIASGAGARTSRRSRSSRSSTPIGR